MSSPPLQSRLEKLEAMLVDEPHDPFLRYSRALELDKIGRSDESVEALSALSTDDPPYVPAFFMAAQQLAALGREEEARGFLTRGIEQAQRTGDDHAAGEMAEFLASLQ